MLHNIVDKYIGKKQLFSLKDKVLVALSGGADSVALLRILLQLGYRCEAAHCNFHLRGDESVRDEEFVRKLCHTYEVPLHTVHFDTQEYAGSKRLSIEMAARELRYNWFEELRREMGFDVIAVAHHRDDSVETFLLNLIRGTGINGLCGIHPKNGTVVRPLLEVSRADILHYLDAIKQDYVTDSTNLQDEYVRNKIRLNILPMMEEINPSVKESIALTASRLEEVARIYRVAMAEGTDFVNDGEGISIERLLRQEAPKSLLYEMLSPLGFNASQVEDIYQCLDGQSGKVFYSAEWRLLKDRSYLLLQPRNEQAREKNHSLELPVNGELLYGKGRKITTAVYNRTSGFEVRKEKNIACLDADKLQFPLIIRRYGAGDSFVPFGMKGRKLISDYLTDRKFSRQAKEDTFVVCSGDKIIWIVGERIDDRFRIDNDTVRIAQLSI